MLNIIQETTKTIATALGAVVIGTVVETTSQIPIGVIVSIGVFILGLAWKQAKWQQKVDDALENILNNQARSTQNQAKLWNHIDNLPCPPSGKQTCENQIDIIGKVGE